MVVTNVSDDRVYDFYRSGKTRRYSAVMGERHVYHVIESSGLHDDLHREQMARHARPSRLSPSRRQDSVLCSLDMPYRIGAGCIMSHVFPPRPSL